MSSQNSGVPIVEKGEVLPEREPGQPGDSPGKNPTCQRARETIVDNINSNLEEGHQPGSTEDTDIFPSNFAANALLTELFNNVEGIQSTTNEQGSLTSTNRKMIKNPKGGFVQYVPQLLERRVDIYRKASIGRSLSDALDELVASNKIDKYLATMVLEQFDRAIARHLPHVRSHLVFNAEKLTNYGLMADNWKLRLKNVTISDASHELDHVEGCTIFASVPEDICI